MYNNNEFIYSGSRTYPTVEGVRHVHLSTPIGEIGNHNTTGLSFSIGEQDNREEEEEYELTGTRHQ